MDMPSSLKNYPVKDIRTPHANDVLSGRGGGTNNHPGNEKFRELVHSKKVLYVNSSKREKALVSCAIVEYIRNQTPVGRFLQRDEKTGLWYDIGDQKAREKTSQALREGAPDIRREISMGAAANALSIAASVAAGVHEHQPANSHAPGSNGTPGSNAGNMSAAGQIRGVSQAAAASADHTPSDDFHSLRRGNIPSMSSLVNNGRAPGTTSMMSQQDTSVEESVARAMFLSRNPDNRHMANNKLPTDQHQDPNFPFPYSVMEMLQRKASSMNSFAPDGASMMPNRHNFAASLASSDPRRRIPDPSLHSQQPMFNPYFAAGPSPSDVFFQQYGPRAGGAMSSERAPSAATAAAMMMGMHHSQPRQTAARIQQAKAAAANAIAAVGKVLAENNMELLRDPSKASQVLNNRTPKNRSSSREQRPDTTNMEFFPNTNNVVKTSASNNSNHKQKKEKHFTMPIEKDNNQNDTNSMNANQMSGNDMGANQKNNPVSDHFKERLFLSEIISKSIVRGKVDAMLCKKERAALMYQFAGLVGIKLEDLTDRLANGSSTLKDLIQKSINEKESKVDVERCSLLITKNTNKRPLDDQYGNTEFSTKRQKEESSLAMRQRITSAFRGINAF